MFMVKVSEHKAPSQGGRLMFRGIFSLTYVLFRDLTQVAGGL